MTAFVVSDLAHIMNSIAWAHNTELLCGLSAQRHRDILGAAYCDLQKPKVFRPLYGLSAQRDRDILGVANLWCADAEGFSALPVYISFMNFLFITEHLS